MSTTNFETLRNVKKGRTDWKVKVRIIREWRGSTITGEPFKGFYVLLLDSKNCRMQAFIPGAVADRMARIIQVGKIYFIKNFQVKDYTEKDKFRPVKCDKQIAFNSDTKLREIDESEIYIPNNMFDFYEFQDLKEMATQYHNLIDVVGIIQKRETVTTKQTAEGKTQTYIKFKLTDGRSKINVTFWNEFAVQFEEAMFNVLEEPIILIIASGRVSMWQNQIDICNYSPTKFYLNYDHHSVTQLRKMLKEPEFSLDEISTKQKSYKLCTVDGIKKLGSDCIQDEVICKGTIKYVEDSQMWKVVVCTSCYKEIQQKDHNYCCNKCNRIVPYPNKKFKVSAVLSDESGQIQITLLDREVRTILKKNVFELEKEDDSFPTIMKTIDISLGKVYLQLLLTEENIKHTNKVYEATDISFDFNMEDKMLDQEQTIQQTQTVTAEPSGPSYHLDDISQLNYQTS